MIALYALCLVIIAMVALKTLTKPGAAIALILGLYVIKQVLQNRFLFITTHSMLTNAAIAGIAGLCFLRFRFNAAQPFHGVVSDRRITTLRNVFLAFTLASVFWSEGTALAGDSWKYSIIYAFLFVYLMPGLMGREEDLTDMLHNFLWLGLACSIAIYFTARWVGRGVEFAGAPLIFDRIKGTYQTSAGNPLEVAGMCVRLVLILILVDARTLGKWFSLIRWPFVLLAVALLLKSLSRGQVVALCFTLLVMFPLTRNFRDVASLLRTSVMLAGILGVFYFIFDFVQSSGRWSTNVVSKDAAFRANIVANSLAAWTGDGIIPFLFGHGYDASFSPRFNIGFPEVGPAALILDVGLFGLVLWIPLLYLGTRSWWRCYMMVRFDPQRRGMVVALGAMALAVFLLSFKEAGYYMIIAWCVMFTRYEGALLAALESTPDGGFAETPYLRQPGYELAPY